MPARRRNAPNIHGLMANAHRSVNTERMTTEPMTANLRPTRSESRPTHTAPMTMPRKAVEPMVPAWAELRFHSSMSSVWTVP